MAFFRLRKAWKRSAAGRLPRCFSRSGTPAYASFPFILPEIDRLRGVKLRKAVSRTTRKRLPRPSVHAEPGSSSRVTSSAAPERSDSTNGSGDFSRKAASASSSSSANGSTAHTPRHFSSRTASELQTGSGKPAIIRTSGNSRRSSSPCSAPI